MRKTELMEWYEEHTGKPSTQVITDGVHHVPGIEMWHWEYAKWLESRVMQLEESNEGLLKKLVDSGVVSIV